mgnify:CR=1 FL=1
MDNLNHNQLIEIVSRSLMESKKNKFLVALSGGIDSILLLNIVNIICRSQKQQLRAIHINHKISKNADAMQKHCVDICNNLKINLLTKEINDVANSNIEENLRNKRYDLIFQSMYDDEALLLGHHNNDQIETFLYRLFRGSSPLGLSCMDKISKRGTNTICRPFLSISKDNIISISRYLIAQFSLFNSDKYTAIKDNTVIKLNDIPARFIVFVLYIFSICGISLNLSSKVS